MNTPETHKPELFYPDEEIKAVRRSGILKYRSSRLPTWCPGCGYFGIDHALMSALNELEIPSHELCIISGIGCTGRYPFFSRGYGLHALHGRALPVATGVKTVRPELSVLVLTGDGDCMGIGAGHLPHACRRNVDITCILFDNNIYGLTKGQTSPTTPHEQNTNSHPFGNPDTPLDPLKIVLSAGASYVARGFAARPDDMQLMLREAIRHRGFSFVHLMSPCVTFDKVNYTYPNLSERVRPLPEDHDYTDRRMALDRAMDDELFVGLFFKQERPTFRDQMDAYAERCHKE